MFSVTDLKKDFPIFTKHPGLVYLDSASTTLKPRQMIAKLRDYYENYSANIKRGVYSLSVKASKEYDETRLACARFINADKDEIVFVRNTTEAINLVAYSIGANIVDSDDEIVVSIMEHHSNFVPWQQLAFNTGAMFKVIDITNDGELNIKSKKADKNSKLDLTQIITKRTKILALTYVSNVLGVINPIKEICSEAKKINPNVIIIVDAAQAAPYAMVDVQDLGCDFLAFSAHKMLGPTGVGVLWGRKKLLQDMFPFLYGGEMVERVFVSRTTFAPTPDKFEAGTPAVAEIIAFKESLSYLSAIGQKAITKHIKELTKYALERLHSEFGKNIKIYGPHDVLKQAGIISFNLLDIHPHDIASIFDQNNICIRGGHHCTMPLHGRLRIAGSCRMSLYIYNDKNDIDEAIVSLKKAYKIFAR